MGPNHVIPHTKSRPMLTASPRVDCSKIPSPRPTCHKKKGTIRCLQNNPGNQAPLNPLWSQVGPYNPQGGVRGHHESPA